MKLRLRSGLKSDVEFFAMADDLLHHRTHLIDLDRIDDEILGAVTIFFGRLPEALRDLFDTVVEYVGKTEQYGRRDIAHLKLIHHLLEVDRCITFARSHSHVTFFVDGEIFQTPSIDIVQLRAVVNTPFSHFRINFSIFI